ncbi:aldehyde dehydrogenase family protein [Burkholderia pseudomallei]|uniref:aldehyde dehydrogenase family protein n=1 Tax=Burkholderia pseudomallei TaxID=28450 RepID=UPI00193CA3EA|nr:aldehyde dehydrogenase family protein [Burkholderia pseudomallei]QRM22897.1 aldehyde dehydrogenase family protein [Burkholderia pseudomallei]
MTNYSDGTALLLGRDAAEFLAEPLGHFIDGGFVHSDRAALFPAIDPASGQECASLEDAAPSTVDMAVEAARRAFNRGWGDSEPDDRQKLLMTLADLVQQDAGTLADLLTADVGALRSAAFHFEVGNTIRTFRYFAGLATKIGGRTIRTSNSAHQEFFAYTVPEPVGVVAIIVPWNAPLMITAWKMAAALAAGCTVVIKPSEDGSLAVCRLAHLVRRAGFPSGVVNVVCGRGQTTGDALLKNSDIDKVAFTGSLAVGRLIYRTAANRIARVGLELGGKSPAIVLPCADLDAAVSGIAMGAFANAGQTCVAGSRVIVHRSKYTEFTGKLVQYAKSLKVGHGFDPESQMGPLISDVQRSRVMRFISIGQEDGRVLVGGNPVERPGYFVEPTVICDLDPHSALLTEEIFGPVITVEAYDHLEEVVTNANESKYGLAAYVWGTSHSAIQRLAKNLRVGTVFVNTPGFPPANVPTGGYRQSGVGRDLGIESLSGYLETKSVISRLD